MNFRSLPAILFCLTWLFEAPAAETLPFPQNRLRDFYAGQARHHLASGRPVPKILPAFPGLDGGIFGHWGQNTEAKYADHELNDMEIGSVISQTLRHFGEVTPSAIIVRLGDVSAVFDPDRLTFTDVWEGGVRWESRRFGLNSGVKPAGRRLIDLSRANWRATSKRFFGFYRSGEQVVFHYEINGVPVYNQLDSQDGKIFNWLTVKQRLPAKVKLNTSLTTDIAYSDEKELPAQFKPRWSGREVITQGKRGSGPGPYVIDTLTIPYRDQNGFRTPMRVGGFDFLPDGRAAVCTFMGDVWLVDGIDEDLDRLVWKRFAAGLHQALGLVVKDGKVLVLGRDQITRLHDLNDDGEADYYECLTRDYPTKPGNSYACTLHQDNDGTLYWFTRSDRFGFTKFVEGDRPVSIATGLRGANGTGVSPDGRIRFCTVQEGDWTPASAIFEVGGNSYHGYFGPREGHGKHGYDMPMCFLPRGIDNSSGDIAFLPDDKRFGPLAGTTIGTSYGACRHYVVLREEIAGRSQGGVVPLTGDFLSGVHRTRLNAKDGHFYLAGSSGWETYAAEPGCLQRVRYIGGELHLPESVETRENGLIVRFNCQVDPASVSLKNAFCQQWNYLYSKAYGSAEYSPRNPSRLGHDPVEIRSLHLLKNGRAVFVEIPQLHPVMQLHLYLDLKTTDGDSFTPDIYYSIFNLGKPFTEFAGYRAIKKEPYPDFPIAGKHPRDPRLLKQEKLGKSTGDFETATINCVPGLKFQPNRIRMKAGRRASIILKNVDVEMPHNLVLVFPDRLDAIGNASMKMAANPKAVAKHYVPEDQGVIAMSPLIHPGEQYAIYFNTPKQPGEYPFLCTFPGHWVITRGVLEIVP